MKEVYIKSCKLCKICIADLMLRQFKRTILTKEYIETKQEEKKERKKESKVEELISTILH